MRVYVLQEGDYSSRQVKGVYSTLELAQAGAKGEDATWEKEEDSGRSRWDAYVADPQYVRMGFRDHWIIEEYTLDSIVTVEATSPQFLQEVRYVQQAHAEGVTGG